MSSKLIFVGLLVLCSVVLLAAADDDLEERNFWKYLDTLDDEADYDNYMKDYDLLDEKSKRSPILNYFQRARGHPKFKPHFARQYRQIFPDRDSDGKCPQGFRGDKSGNCREIW